MTGGAAGGVGPGTAVPPPISPIRAKGGRVGAGGGVAPDLADQAGGISAHGSQAAEHAHSSAARMTTATPAGRDVHIDPAAGLARRRPLGVGAGRRGTQQAGRHEGARRCSDDQPMGRGHTHADRRRAITTPTDPSPTIAAAPTANHIQASLPAPGALVGPFPPVAGKGSALLD